MQLSCLTGLAGMQITSPLTQQAGSMVVLLHLVGCNVAMDGHSLACLLLACPVLQHTDVYLTGLGTAPISQPSDVLLQPHATLRRVELTNCRAWGTSAAAAMQFAAVAAVLCHVRELVLTQWPQDSSSSSSSSAGGSMPNLSLCTSVTSLCFGCMAAPADAPLVPEQEEVLSMLAPLMQLRQLKILGVWRLNARAVLTLQHMLPRLSSVRLVACGSLLPVPAAAPNEQQQEEDHQQQQEQQHHEQRALARVKQLLRPGLVLEVL
jgi:hypothetical protein